ncbi:MAG TPA: hypothetical protein VD948_03000, partial [Rhodothermales bacterium]|nr:hypothetical protein [Rhodothermales bacterium]
MIREQDTDGAPLGSYEVEYWRYGEYGPNGEGGFRRDRASDLYATLAYVERLTAEPAEVIRAIC